MNIKLKLFLFSILISVSSLGFAVDNGTWTYDVNSDGTSITLTGTSSFPSEPAGLTIPETIDGYDVTVIDDSAFTNQYITSLSLPTTLITIGENAFSYNWLTSLTIPENVVTIKDYAFLDQADETNEKLQNLTLGSSVASIGTQAFKKNELNSILFASTVQSIGEEAFFDNKLTIAQFQGNRPTITASSFGANFSLDPIEYCIRATGWPGESILNGGNYIIPSSNLAICPAVDSDGDGVIDENDHFPSNPSEWLDTDGDGTGNNADSDDDGDGTPDSQDNYPLDCASSSAQIALRSQSDVNDLAFSGCESVQGELYIDRSVINLDGLEKLKFIGGHLTMYQASGLTNIDGLMNLESVGGDIYIYKTAISSVSIFNKINGLTGSITFRENAELVNITGFQNITNVTGSITFRQNSNLVSMNGFNSLASIGKDLVIQSNSAMSNMDGFENLTSIDNDLLISGISCSVNDLKAFSNLVSIGRSFQVNACGLVSLDGLSNLSSIDFLTIQGCDQLTSLSGLPGFENLGSLTIENNDVLESIVSLEPLRTVSNHIIIRDNPLLIDLKGLQNLESVGDLLTIARNNSLSALSGLDRLASVGGDFKVYENSGLVNFGADGLINLKLIEGEFSIYKNQSLQKIDNLDSLTTVSGYLWIWDNFALESLNGLKFLKSSYSVVVTGNTALTTCDGLEELGERHVGYWNFTENGVDCNYLNDPDGDGVLNQYDDDDDGDGFIDTLDAFPFDPTEWLDSDQDGIGNNSDAFPNDASETTDSDGDGIGNNADPDDDNDGVVDNEDAFPLNTNESIDSDGDGIGNNADPDDDNDGVSDINDQYSLISLNGRLDTDGDGIPNDCDSDCLAVGMTADLDDDNDGVSDASDAFPLISLNGLLDTDSDGRPNDCDSQCLQSGMTADLDDDNDGVPDDWRVVFKNQAIFGENVGDTSGYSIDFSSNANVIAIGAPLNDKGQSSQSSVNNGHIRVYERVGSNWDQVGEDIDGPSSGDRFGYRVSLSGDGLVMATSSNWSYQARAFNWNGQEWISRDNNQCCVKGGGYFGDELALSNDANLMVVGATAGGSLIATGSAWVYAWDQSKDAWELETSIAGLMTGDAFGSGISLSANNQILAVGGYGANNSTGHVRVFQRINDGWIQLGDPIAGNPSVTSPYAYSGYKTSLSKDGSSIIIGAMGDVARVYSWNGNQWLQKGNTPSELIARGVNISNDGSLITITDTNTTQIYEWANQNWRKVGSDILGGWEQIAMSDDGKTLAIPDIYDGAGVVKIYSVEKDLYPFNNLYSYDSDGDGMPDAWEIRYRLDPNDPSDATSDRDYDGVTALDEFLAGTIPSGSIDLDGNDQYDALTDGLLLLRGMFGLDGSALVTGTIASDATYTESVDIESRIETLGDLADIDGNGDIDALTDGLLTLRYLFGLQGDTLINGVIAGDATRKTAEEIEAHLETLMPAL